MVWYHIMIRQKRTEVIDLTNDFAKTIQHCPDVTNFNTAGLMNVGCTCYLNSTLQALVHSYHLSTFLLQYSPDKHHDRPTPIFDALMELYNHTWQKGNLGNPMPFLQALRKKIPQDVMFLFQQNDAMEFLVLFIDILNTELGTPHVRKTLPNHVSGLKALKSLMYDSWLNSHSLAYSPFTHVFNGQNVIQVKCSECNTSEHQGEVFSVLHLSFEQGNETYKLQEMIANAFKCEDVIRTCDSCKEKNKKGVRSARVWKLPKALIVHLKRFDGRGSKVTYPVQVPLEINLDSVCIYDPSTQFTLKSIICHQGSCSGGHYFAVTRTNELEDKWTIVDDDHVQLTKVSLNQLNSSTFYAMVYDRL